MDRRRIMEAVLMVLLMAPMAGVASSFTMEQVKKAGIPTDELGIWIASADGEHEVILELNSDKTFVPASISKVATSAAVLSAFPPGTKFKTSLWSTGTVRDGILKGAVYLKGGGDPGFVSENMWFLVNHFRRTGITRIDGDIVVDDSLFDRVRFDESREDARVDRAYDAPVGAMSFNWNSINVFVRPGEAGGPARVFLDPENDYTRLVNKTQTVKGSANSLEVNRAGGADGDTVTVSGRIGLANGEVVIYKNVTQPDLWAGANLKAFLAQRGISVTGKVRNGVTPREADLRAESDSKPVESLLADMNKFSNNFVAEMLTKSLASLDAQPATLAGGVSRIRSHLKEMGVDPDKFRFENPSGLTRENRLSAREMGRVLQSLHSDFRVQPEFLTSLPIAGIDGTLKRRMKGSPAERWVRAKTGLLDGVTALAGYAGRSDGRVYCFVFIHNGRRDESRLRRLFDEWLIRLVS